MCRQLDHSETLAQLIVSHALQVPVEHRDRETHLGLHDFDIQLSPPVPLEVKTATDEDLRRLFAGLIKHGMELPVEGRCDWQINLRANADIKRLERRKGQLALGLRAIEESHGPNYFDRRRSPSRYGSTVEAFCEVFPEIESAWGWGFPKQPPKIHLLPPTAGGAVGPGVINPFVTKFLTERALGGAFDKLLRTGSERRHVFIWLESTLPLISSSFCDNVLPESGPDLPDVVTDVWLAGYCRGVQVQAWRCGTDELWEAVCGLESLFSD